ncbi:MAG: aldehyde reductase [Hyphomonadaceae bacterium]
MTGSKVLVTGASGFIGLHCIDQLLKAGHQVRGTLRTMSREAEVREALGEPGDALEFAYADLTKDEGWDEAVAGCEYVLHVASPFPPTEPKHEDELIIPARDGALRLLRAAKAGGVKRVVLTSSMAAIAYGEKKSNSYVFSEKDWTDVNTPGLDAYVKSKTIAERAAWDFVKENGGPELSVINPGGVLGPLLAKDYSTSGDLVKLLMDRAMPAIPRIGFALVDVRDVAAAHIAAMTVPEAAGERFLCCLDHSWLQDTAKILDAKYGAEGWKIPTGALPSFVVRIGAMFDKTLRRTKPMLGREVHVDNSHIRKILNWQPYSNEEMVIAMADSMIALGVVKKG